MTIPCHDARCRPSQGGANRQESPCWAPSRWLLSACRSWAATTALSLGPIRALRQFGTPPGRTQGEGPCGVLASDAPKAATKATKGRENPPSVASVAVYAPVSFMRLLRGRPGDSISSWMRLVRPELTYASLLV